MSVNFLKITAALAASFFLVFPSRADLITLTSGRSIQGVILQTNDSDLFILADDGATTIPASLLKNVQPEARTRPTTLTTNAVSRKTRLPEWKSILASLANHAWAAKLRQIPATVITNGVLRNVPYVSFRCGIDYEVNIYGDLDAPAGVGVGMYRTLLDKDYAKENATKFMSSILLKSADRDIVSGLDHNKAVKSSNGMTFEVTPPTAEDSYGGWWVSVYDTAALDAARASDAELQQISVLNSAVIKTPPDSASDAAWTRSDLQYARPVASASSVPSTTVQPGNPPAAYSVNSLHPDVLPEHDHGSVYVRAYYRKDGTYVHSYTRRR